MVSGSLLNGIFKKPVAEHTLPLRADTAAELSAPVPVVPACGQYAGSAGVNQYPNAMQDKQSVNRLPAVAALQPPAGLFPIYVTCKVFQARSSGPCIQ